jgi:saccharopine dehydrogenase-like NADP-dependent oxidoreductase
MGSNILIVGGKGIVGKTIHRILRSRNQECNIYIGSRKEGTTEYDVMIDVNKPETFKAVVDRNIDLIILAVNDQNDHILRFAIDNSIDYIDITKPTPDLVKALAIAETTQNINSRIVFSSGWMGGLVSGLMNTLSHSPENIQEVKLYVYYSVKDLAGESSAHFMAENVAKPFICYQSNRQISVRHFLNSEDFKFSFGIGKRQAYNFDVPDLYILNQIEKIPTVNVKMTYDSKLITWLLGTFQKLRIFNILSLKERRAIFGSSGNGDQSVFEIIIKDDQGEKKLSLQSKKGQAELTALAAVLHAEMLLDGDFKNKIYFAHQLHDPKKLYQSLAEYEGITIEAKI